MKWGDPVSGSPHLSGGRCCLPHVFRNLICCQSLSIPPAFLGGELNVIFPTFRVQPLPLVIALAAVGCDAVFK